MMSENTELLALFSNLPVADVIVADGDGVIAVPRAVARDVAKHAHAEHKRDIRSRRKLYEALRMEVDDCVKEYGDEDDGA
jgi:regulator of RNase E activity RraA